MATQIRLRRGTIAEWAAANPVLALGEMGLETDNPTRNIKIGDGVTSWNDLDHIGTLGETGPQGDAGTIYWKGDYDPLVTYTKDDGVIYQGSGYVALTESTGSIPPSVDWQMIAKGGADGEGSGDMLKAVYDPTDSGKVGVSNYAETAPWTGIQSKPETFTPSAHTHEISEVIDLSSILGAKADLIDGEVPSSQLPDNSADNVIETDDRKFVTAAEKDYLEGVINPFENGPLGVSSENGWHRIDIDSEPVIVPGLVNKTLGLHTGFNDVPIYRDIVTMSVESNGGTQTVVKIPTTFYYKRQGTGLAGDPYKLWINPEPYEGFARVPAAMKAGVAQDFFQIGAYTCNGDGYDSVAGAMPKVSVSFTTAQSAIPAAHGTDWNMWDIYQLSAIQMLFLVEFGDPDAQTLIGQGNSSSSAAVVGGASDAIYRGIHELWANVWQMVDGFKGDSSSVAQIWNPDGTKVYVSTGVTPAAGDGTAITSMLTDSGTDYDLGAVNVYGASGSAAFNDKYWGPVANFVAYHGGRLGHGAGDGVFALNLRVVALNSNTNIGCRLAKV